MYTQISYTSEPYDDDDDDDDDDDADNSTIISAANDTTLYYLLTGLRPGTQYQTSVMASTSVGLGPAVELIVMTSSNSEIILHTTVIVYKISLDSLKGAQILILLH